MRTLAQRIVAWMQSEQGASLVEYALLISLIALAAFAAVVFFGESVNSSLTSSASRIEVAG